MKRAITITEVQQGTTGTEYKRKGIPIVRIDDYTPVKISVWKDNMVSLEPVEITQITKVNGDKVLAKESVDEITAMLNED